MSDELTVDDLATQEDLEELRGLIEGMSDDDGESGGDDGGEFELPDDVVTRDELPELVGATTEKTAKEFFQHLRDDECDDPECQHAREALGWDHADDDGDDGEESGDDGDGDGDDDGEEGSDDGGTVEETNAAFPDEL